MQNPYFPKLSSKKDAVYSAKKNEEIRNHHVEQSRFEILEPSKIKENHAKKGLIYEIDWNNGGVEDTHTLTKRELEFLEEYLRDLVSVVNSTDFPEKIKNCIARELLKISHHFLSGDRFIPGEYKYFAKQLQSPHHSNFFLCLRRLAKESETTLVHPTSGALCMIEDKDLSFKYLVCDLFTMGNVDGECLCEKVLGKLKNR